MTTPDGITSLHFAVKKERYPVIKVLLENGANPNLKLPMTQKTVWEFKEADELLTWHMQVFMKRKFVDEAKRLLSELHKDDDPDIWTRD